MPTGYMVVRDEAGTMVSDWDGTIHPTRHEAAVEALTAKRQEPLYDWYLTEVRRVVPEAHQVLV